MLSRYGSTAGQGRPGCVVQSSGREGTDGSAGGRVGESSIPARRNVDHRDQVLVQLVPAVISPLVLECVFVMRKMPFQERSELDEVPDTFPSLTSPPRTQSAPESVSLVTYIAVMAMMRFTRKRSTRTSFHIPRYCVIISSSHSYVNPFHGRFPPS